MRVTLGGGATAAESKINGLISKHPLVNMHTFKRKAPGFLLSGN